VLAIVTVLECGWTLDAVESKMIEHVDNFAIGSFGLVNGSAVGTVVFSFGPFLYARLAIEFVALPTLYHVRCDDG